MNIQKVVDIKKNSLKPISNRKVWGTWKDQSDGQVKEAG